jgi:peptidoglycan-associated lipoprotein
MSHRRIIVSALAFVLVLGACSKEPPPPPEPTGPSQEELERMRADSIARAQEEARRLEEERRQREAEEARRAAVAAARGTLTEMVFFDYDESAITLDAERILRQKVDIMRASPMVQMRLEGHADERGSTEYNVALGNRRAEAVKQFFASFGIDESRFSMVSYGEERPRVRDSSEEAWAQNRRVEFVLTAGANDINPPSDR